MPAPQERVQAARAGGAVRAGRRFGSALCVAAALVFTPPAAPASAALSGAPVDVASGLNTPWDVVPLPGGRVLVTDGPAVSG